MYRAREKQMSIYDYLPPYHGELFIDDPAAPQTDAYGRARSLHDARAICGPGGKVALPARVALGCRIIQLHYAASDREVVALVQESPYLQYFLGFESFTDAVPFSSRTVARFRARIPDKAVRPAVRLLRSFQ